MRHVLGWMALAASVAGWCGAPSPAPRGAATAYPCAAHACGCRSAQQCWSACCCFSVAQRMEWARIHGAAYRGALDDERSQPSSDSSRACCETPSPDRNTAPIARHTSKADRVAGIVGPAFSALKCQGLSAWSGPMSLAAFPADLTVVREVGPVEALVLGTSPPPTSAVLELTPPPPRRLPRA